MFPFLFQGEQLPWAPLKAHSSCSPRRTNSCRAWEGNPSFQHEAGPGQPQNCGLNDSAGDYRNCRCDVDGGEAAAAARRQAQGRVAGQPQDLVF